MTVMYAVGKAHLRKCCPAPALSKLSTPVCALTARGTVALRRRGQLGPSHDLDESVPVWPLLRRLTVPRAVRLQVVANGIAPFGVEALGWPRCNKPARRTAASHRQGLSCEATHFSAEALLPSSLCRQSLSVSSCSRWLPEYESSRLLFTSASKHCLHHVQASVSSPGDCHPRVSCTPARYSPWQGTCVVQDTGGAGHTRWGTMLCRNDVTCAQLEAMILSCVAGQGHLHENTQ